jgi:mannose-6-phosphate isomerase-like protein (cupin superfamily)
MQIESHSSNIIKKPWGYEYLVYEDATIAIWFLYIAYGEKTSLHSHPSKTTGLIVLDGKAEINFFTDCKVLSKLDKIMIRKGLFHSTKSISETGTMLFEIETPNNKLDLVRLDDAYGRKGKPYEDSSFEYPKKNDCLWIENQNFNEEFSFANCKITKKHIKSTSELYHLKDNIKLMFLEGGIITEYDVPIICPGDIITIEIYKKLSQVFKKVKDETILLIFEE